MLVVSRKRDESVRINDNITVKVVEIRGDKVRIGITAPNEVPVHREEVYQNIVKSNGKISSGGKLSRRRLPEKS